MTKQIDEESLKHSAVQTIRFQQQANIEQIPRMLTIQRCANLAAVQVWKRNHAYCGKPEFLLNLTDDIKPIRRMQRPSQYGRDFYLDLDTIPANQGSLLIRTLLPQIHLDSRQPGSHLSGHALQCRAALPQGFVARQQRQENQINVR